MAPGHDRRKPYKTDERVSPCSSPVEHRLAAPPSAVSLMRFSFFARTPHDRKGYPAARKNRVQVTS